MRLKKFRGDKKEDHIDGLFEALWLLEFDLCRKKLVIYLDTQRKKAAVMIANEMPSVCELRDRAEIVKVLVYIGDQGNHAKIYRAYVQMRLYDVLQEQGEEDSDLIDLCKQDREACS